MTQAVDLSRYNKEEREIIAVVERSKGQPLTQWEIDLALEQAWMIGHLTEQPRLDEAARMALTHASDPRRLLKRS